MIYPASVIFHGLLGALGLVSFLYLYLFKKDADGKAVEEYYKWFLFFFLYNVSLLIPLFVFDEIGANFGLLYNISLVFLAIATWHGFRLALHLRMGAGRVRSVASSLYIIAAAVIVLLQFIFPEIPTDSEDLRWVFWRSRDIATYLYIALMFVAGWTFSYVNFEAFLKPSTAILKSRLLLYALAGFVLPISAAFYFGASSVREIHISYAISVAGMVFFALGNILIGLLLKSSRQSP